MAIYLQVVGHTLYSVLVNIVKPKNLFNIINAKVCMVRCLLLNHARITEWIWMKFGTDIR